MPIARIKPFAKNGVYFVTPTVWNWYDLFDRHNRWQIIADSLRYCQDHKDILPPSGLQVGPARSPHPLEIL